jgi:hypothetical protein
MNRAIIAIALLAASWLPAIGYFHLPDATLASILILAGVLMLIGMRNWEIDRAHAVAGAILSACAMFLIPAPYRAIALLLACGLASFAFPIPVRWMRALGSAAISAGFILLIQTIPLNLYTNFTARSHELPSSIGVAIAWIPQALGIDAAYDGSNISLGTMRANHPMAASWELLLDPAMFCFLVSAIVWIGMRNWRGWVALIACAIAWIPIRVALLLGLFMHRALRTDFDAPLELMGQFWDFWLNLAMILCAALLASRFIVKTRPATPTAIVSSRAAWIAATAACIGGILLALLLYLDPPGERKAGRVMIDEFHSKWEPTEEPFDENSYGHNAAYTYKVLYEYLSRFYDISRIKSGMTSETLKKCDVLIVKVPTVKYSDNEIKRIRDFVRDGGGLLLVGEHTDVFGTGTYLNDIARTFGFTYRYDCLFDIDQVFQQKYRAALVPHPIVQSLPELDWAVSCSIAPDLTSTGRAVVVSTGLRNLPADYHASNFYPQVEDRADARYGSFVQLWETTHGQGRVVGFTDSTQFSNFCLFDPGKSELFVGMVEWLNHRSGNDPRYALGGLTIIALLLSWSLARNRLSAIPLACSAAIFGFSLALPILRSAQQRAMPLPKATNPMVRVVMDRTVCDSTLPLAGFIAGKPDGFGIFERWILRLGYFTARRSGADALHDNLLVFTYPDKPVSRDFRDAVERYVNDGGKILVIDSAENQHSTANSILWPYKIQVKRDATLAGDLDLTSSTSTTQPATTSVSPVSVTNAVEVSVDKDANAEILAKVTDKPVSLSVKHGKGSVTVVGYGSRFTDQNYGFTGDNEPDAAMRSAYQVQFDLIRKIVEEQPLSTKLGASQ